MYPARLSASLGELVATAYDFAAEQSADPDEVAELVASVVGDLRDRSYAFRQKQRGHRRLGVSPPIL
jgi:hypothetical protein